MEKFLRVERQVQVGSGLRQRSEWRMVPNCEKVPIWEMTSGDALDGRNEVSSKRIAFHVPFLQGVVRGCRVVFYGERYEIVEVSDSPRLRGIELRCTPIAAAHAAA